LPLNDFAVVVGSIINKRSITDRMMSSIFVSYRYWILLKRIALLFFTDLSHFLTDYMSSYIINVIMQRLYTYFHFQQENGYNLRDGYWPQEGAQSNPKHYKETATFYAKRGTYLKSLFIKVIYSWWHISRF